ncbi:MAG TPA: lysylphosphatidylglycerol synthase transmembrane domain-containing protein [Gaiellaceae bacterium]
MAAVVQRRLGLLNAAVSLAALAGVVWWAARQKAPHVPLRADALAALAGAVALYALTSALRAERWHRILVRNGIDRGRAEAYRLTAVGYMGNNTLPARAGDLLRVVLLGGSRRAALGTVVAERLLDVVALAAIFAVVVLDRGLGFGPLPYLAAAGLLAVAIVAAAVRLSDKLSQAIRPVAAASQELLSAHGAGLLALSVALWAGEASVYLVVGLATDVHLGLSGALYVVALTNLSALVPAAPGYVGTFDAAVLLALRSLGRPALGYLLVLRFVLFVPITVVGAAVYFTRYGRRRR